MKEFKKKLSKSNYMTRYSLWLLGTLILIFSACSKKSIPLSTIVSEPKPNLSIHEIDFEYFHGKARMVLRDGNKELDVKANIRVRKDSVIWMAFNVKGIQGGKALIDKDSITVLNTVKKEYYVFEYNELSRRFNFDINFDIIQAAMLGNPILPLNQEKDEITRENSMFVLKQSSGTVFVMNLINAASMKIEKVELTESDTKNILSIQYSDFQQVENKVFPFTGNISLVYQAPAGLLNTTIIFEYNKAEVGDKELKFPFNIPKKYDRR